MKRYFYITQSRSKLPYRGQAWQHDVPKVFIRRRVAEHWASMLEYRYRQMFTERAQPKKFHVETLDWAHIEHCDCPCGGTGRSQDGTELCLFCDCGIHAYIQATFHFPEKKHVHP